MRELSTTDVAPAAGRSPRFAHWAESLPSTPGQDLMAVARRPDVLSFALGLPAAEFFPSAILGELARDLMADDPAVLQYGVPEQLLKAQIVEIMRRRDVECSAEEVFLTSGAQQGISLLLQLLLEPGAAALCEEHTYFGFLQAARPLQCRMVTVPSDDCGMDLEAAERALRNEDVRLIYVIPDGNNPLGTSLSLERRLLLARMAEEYSVPIVEDDPYGLLQYDARPNPPVRAYSKNWVCHIGSFSKVIAPGLRLGWVVAPPEITRMLGSLKAGADVDTGNFGQRLAAAFLASVDFEARVEGLRARYRERRDAMERALEESLPHARWTRTSAGFFIWVELLGSIDTRHLLRSALSVEGVAFVPGSEFRANPVRDEICRTLRLSFSSRRPGEIREGIARLGAAVTRAAVP